MPSKIRTIYINLATISKMNYFKFLLKTASILIILIFLISPLISGNINIAHADFLDSSLNGCTLPDIPPVIYPPGTDVTLVIRTKAETKYFGLDIDVTNKNTGITRSITFNDESPTYTHIIDLGAYDDPGIYKIHVGYYTTLCELDAAFTIKDPSSTIKLDAPVSPVTSKITTLPQLKISGLIAGQIYHIKLQNWKGADLDKDRTSGNNDGSQNWLANSSGVVEAVNICNNGQANRTDCSETFGNQSYGLDIYKTGLEACPVGYVALPEPFSDLCGRPKPPSGCSIDEKELELLGTTYCFIKLGVETYVGSVSFVVDTNASDGGGSLGNNPCIDTNGDGKVDTCPTAIGYIPTNLGDFATAVLRIALGISGGIVLILMVIGSIRVMTSSGDPKNVAAGRDMIVAAIAGALFIAFSVMIMQFLGTAVVPIPGLVFGT